MADNRYTKRHRKRIAVSFGLGRPEKFGFTDDINHGGLFIRSAVVAKQGTVINIEIKQSQGVIAMLGEVRWTKKVPPNVLHKLKGGMGVKILGFRSGKDLYEALCDELVAQRGA